MFTSIPKKLGISALLACFTTASFGADLGLPPRGAITLSFDSAPNTVAYNDSEQSIAVTERFEEGSRKDSGRLTFLDGPTILSFTPGQSCSSIGFTENKDWIGCFKKGGIGTGRLSNGQSLSVSIIPTGPAAGTTVTSWVLGFTAKQNVTAEIVLSIDGSETETLYLFTGLSAGDAPTGDNIFTCSEGPDSNPDSDTACVIEGSQPFQSAEIKVTNDGELSIGSSMTTLNLSAMTGVLTCEEDASGSPTTTVEDIFLIEDPFAGAVQCRRLPNRSGAACQAVPYLLEASCDGGACTMDFVHGDQQDTRPGEDPSLPLPREDYAFLCEIWWPGRTGGTGEAGQGGDVLKGQFANGILPKTEILWGGDTTASNPPAPGDVLVDYCSGITPLFDSDMEPNSSTVCGDTLSYRLSEAGNPDVSGGTVAPDSTQCSLLEAYDDILVRSDFPDQCDDDAACPAGRQIACLIDSRTSQVQDPDAVPDTSTPGGVIGVPTSIYRSYELIYIEGDLRMRRF